MTFYDCYQIGSIELENEYAAPYLKGTKAARMPAPISEIQKYTEDIIQHTIKATGATEYICCLSGKGNFRNEVAKQQPYKGNREDFIRPYHYTTVGDYICSNHPTVIVDGMEADDWMGIEQRKDIDNSIIASRDKDLKTVSGWHYRWACGENQPEVLPHWISEFESKHFFFHQMLIGDSTDNICGCGRRREVMWGGKLCMRRKGIGEKAAISLLSNCRSIQDLYDVVSQCYQNEFGDTWEDAMLENARLLFIGQTPDNLFDWDWIDYTLEKEIINDEVICGTGTEPENNSSGESREI